MSRRRAKGRPIPGLFIPFKGQQAQKPKHIHHHHQVPAKKEDVDPQLIVSVLAIVGLVIGGVVWFAAMQPIWFVVVAGAIGFGIWHFFYK